MSAIPYDEMRRLCGLPDVRRQAARDRRALAFRRLAAAARRVAASFGVDEDPRQSDYALARGK